MRVITVLLITVVGLACCANVPSTTETNHQLYPVCKTTLDFLRNDENVLNIIKYDEQFSSEFIGLLESDISSENLCGLLAVRQTGNEFFIGGIVRAVGAIIKVASGAARAAGSAARAVGSAARAGARAAKTVARVAKKAYKVGSKVNKAYKQARRVNRAYKDYKNDRKKRKKRHHD